MPITTTWDFGTGARVGTYLRLRDANGTIATVIAERANALFFPVIHKGEGLSNATAAP